MEIAAIGHSEPRPQPERQRTVLSRAVVRVAQALSLSQGRLATVLGLSRPSVQRLTAGTYLLRPPPAKEWEMAVLLVRVYRSLMAIVGQEAAARAWLEGPNTDLGIEPTRLLDSAEGLVTLVRYLDAHRGV